MINSIFHNIYPYFKITRPLNCILSGLALVVGILITLGPNLLIDEYSIVILGSIVLILVSAGGFVINDIFDVEIDRINQPERILPSGRMSIRQAYIFTLFLFVSSVLISGFALLLETSFEFGTLPMLFTIFGIASLIIYAKWLKKYFLGNLLISILASIPILAGGVFIGDLTRVIFPVVLVFLFTYSREIIKDIEDVKGDVQASESFYSLPVLVGLRPTVNIARILLISLSLFSLLPFILSELSYFLSISMIVFASLINLLIILVLFELKGDEDRLITSARKSRKLLKLGAVFGLIGLVFNHFTPLV